MDPELQGLLPHVPDDLFLDVDDDDQEFIEPEAEMPEADDMTPEQYDEYLNAKFQILNQFLLNLLYQQNLHLCPFFLELLL